MCDEISDTNTEYTKRLGFKITEKEKTLPIMYWILNMHKIPTGAHFITASNICPTEKFSKSNVFKLVYSQVENFHKNAKFLSNFNKLWVLQNSDTIIQSINNINKKRMPNLLQSI